MSVLIIVVCLLLMMAYVFDLSSSRTRIPTVILLLVLGWIVRQLSEYYELEVLPLENWLPVLGTIGLILIVLQGSLELKLSSDRMRIFRKASILAISPLFILAFILAFLFQHYTDCSLKDGLANAVPFCVISSAIAIPSVIHLSRDRRDYVIYDSVISDIVGIVFFNFVVFNEVVGVKSFAFFILEIALIIVVSVVSVLGIAMLMRRINHRIKYIPITILVIMVYTFLSLFQLPGLVFILVFGLFLGNADSIHEIRWFKKWESKLKDSEVKNFKDFVTEATFLFRSLFFILFGYLLNTADILDGEAFNWAAGICLLIFLLRLIHLKLLSLPIFPLIFIAPRGLITILLVLTILPHQKIAIINNAVMVQVIVISAFFMMIGLIFTKKNNVIEET